MGLQKLNNCNLIDDHNKPADKSQTPEKSPVVQPEWWVKCSNAQMLQKSHSNYPVLTPGLTPKTTTTYTTVFFKRKILWSMVHLIAPDTSRCYAFYTVVALAEKVSF